MVFFSIIFIAIYYLLIYKKVSDKLYNNGKILSYDNLNVATLMYAIEDAKQLKPKRLNMNGSNFVKTLFNSGESECMN